MGKYQLRIVQIQILKILIKQILMLVLIIAIIIFIFKIYFLILIQINLVDNGVNGSKYCILRKGGELKMILLKFKNYLHNNYTQIT